MGWRRDEARALCELGKTYVKLDQFDDAECAFKSTLALYHQEIGDRTGEADTLFRIGWLRYRQHRYDEARIEFQSAHDLADVEGDLNNQGRAIAGLGRVHWDCGELDMAQTCLENALGLFERAQRADNVAYARDDLERLRLARQSTQNEDEPSPQATTQATSAAAIEKPKDASSSGDSTEDARAHGDEISLEDNEHASEVGKKSGDEVDELPVSV